MLVLCGIPWAVFSQTASASSANNPGLIAAPSRHAARVARGTDVVAQWQNNQHLYVKGDVGVGSEQLDQLEVWLGENAPNWTVALLESAAGERYTDASGTVFNGLDAVENALDKGLANQTAFGQLVDPRTQKRNGAFFILFLKDRKFSYYGSDAQDKRGLGEDRWVGNLDQPAIAAMRSGGRIVDAVKDTITSINRRLDQKIAAEKTAREQQLAAETVARERQLAAEQAAKTLALERARAGLKTAVEAINLLEQQVGELARSSTALTGDLARPDPGTIAGRVGHRPSSLRQWQSSTGCGDDQPDQGARRLPDPRDRGLSRGRTKN